MKSRLPEIARKISQFDEKEIEIFFRAFFTPQELATLDHRYRLVELLVKGMPQREIAEEVGVSISQISRGSQELKFGYGKKIFPQIFAEK